MFEFSQLEMLKRSGIIETDLPEQPEHEILRYFLKNNYFTVEFNGGDIRQTYARITRHPAKIVIYEEKISDAENVHNLLFILKVDRQGDLMLHSLTEVSRKGMVEYENGYPYIRLPQTNTSVSWRYCFHDIRVDCTSEFSTTKVEGKDCPALTVTRRHQSAHGANPQRSYTEKETYVAGHGILSRECSRS